MRLAPRLCLLAALPLALSPSFARVADPFSITLTVPQQEVKAGAEVKAEIMLRNTSSHEISLSRVVGEERAEFEYAVEVRDGRGHLAPETQYGRNLRNRTPAPDVPRFFSSLIFALQPGETWAEVAAITKLYDLGRPGKYTIQVSREIPRELGKGTVKSNQITITVIK
jgi:hypothetical protein